MMRALKSKWSRIIWLPAALAGAFLLVAGYAWAQLPFPHHNEPTVTTIYDPHQMTIWAPHHKTFELQWAVAPSWTNPLVQDESIVRPAWILFAAVVAVAFCIWTNFEHSGIRFNYPF